MGPVKFSHGTPVWYLPSLKDFKLMNFTSLHVYPCVPSFLPLYIGMLGQQFLTSFLPFPLQTLERYLEKESVILGSQGSRMS